MKKVQCWYLLPLVFLITYFIVNFYALNIFYNEENDLALNALLIMRAGQFKELLGPSSRFGFNHIGPISFYYYAFTEPLFFFAKSIYSKHIFAQLILNISFLIWTLKIIDELYSAKIWPVIFMAVFLISIYPLGKDIFYNIWGPAILVFPFLLFFVSATSVSAGNIKSSLPFFISTIFIVQNHIGAIPLVLIIIASVVVLYWHAYKKDSTDFTRNIKYLYCGLGFLSMCFFPVLLEMVINHGGNIKKIIHFFHGNGGFQHRTHETLKYIIDFYTLPLKIKEWIIAEVVMICLLFFTVVNFFVGRKIIKIMTMLLIVSLFLSFYSAKKIVGDMYPYLMWFQYSLAAIIYFLAINGLLGIWVVIRKKPASDLFTSNNKMMLYIKSILSVAIIIVVPLIYAVPPLNSNEKIDKLIEMINPDKNHAYLLDWGKMGGRHHFQWGIADALLLKMKRLGLRVYVPKQWAIRDEYAWDGDQDVKKIYIFNSEIYDPDHDRPFETMYTIDDVKIAFGE